MAPSLNTTTIGSIHEASRTRAVEPSSGGDRYIAELDGLRAVAVTAVLLFHADITWMRGGYLGVSLFFTLSGYVVSRSLLARWDDAAPARTVMEFYGRRVKRLLPASASTLCGVLALARLGVVDTTAAEVRWSAVNLANWYQLHQASDYSALLVAMTNQRASPLVHYWSLAIEEQFYLLLPLAFIATRGRRRLPRFHWLVVGYAIVATVVVLAAATSGPDTVYFDTRFRIVEIIAGCVAAQWVPRNRAQLRWLHVAAPWSFIAIAAALSATGDSATSWPADGLLPVFAVISAVAIVAAHHGAPGTQLLRARALVGLGRISYGVYLVHWPIYQLVDPLLQRLVLTLIAATLLYFAIERPIRRAAFTPVIVLSTAAVTTAIIVLLASLVPAARFVHVAPPDPGEAPAIAAAREPTTSVRETSTSPPAARAPSPINTSPRDEEPQHVMVFGDSTAAALAAGLADALTDHGPDLQLEVLAGGGCGIVRGGEYRVKLFNAGLHVHCNELLDETLPAALERGTADVLVIYITLADTWERSWDGGRTWLEPTDPDYRDRIRDDYTAFVRRALDHGVQQIYWVRPPVPLDLSTNPPTPESSYLSGGQAAIEFAIDEIARTNPDQVRMADLRGWLEAQAPPWDVETTRPDGIHFAPVAAREVADLWLLPLLGGAGS